MRTMKSRFALVGLLIAGSLVACDNPVGPQMQGVVDQGPQKGGVIIGGPQKGGIIVQGPQKGGVIIQGPQK